VKVGARELLRRVPSTDFIGDLRTRWFRRNGWEPASMVWERRMPFKDLMDGLEAYAHRETVCRASPSVFPTNSFVADHAWEIHEYETASGLIVRRRRRRDYTHWSLWEARWIYDGD
jgi:hypothetical protein